MKFNFFIINLISIFFIKSQNKEFEYLFIHGLAAGKEQLKFYQRIIPTPYEGIAFDCVDVQEKPLYPELIKIPPTAFGQEKDIEIFSDFIKNSERKIIGIGVSKGAACWINIASKNEYIDKLAALVLESPFADINEIICRFKFVDYLNYIPCGYLITQSYAKKILKYYDPFGMQPLTSIQKIKNKELPIFLIHSKADKLIPINHSRKLYKEFLKNGFKNVYLVETEHAKHANVLTQDTENLFKKTIHSFYKKFNFPYNQELIEYDIDNFKPSIEEIDKRIKNDTSYLKEYSPITIKILIILFFACILKFYLPTK